MHNTGAEPSDTLSSVPSSAPVYRERGAGTVMAFISTFCFGLSNAFVRLMTEYNADIDWLLFYKELTGFLLILPWLLYRYYQGRYRLTSKLFILYVAIGAIFCELIGARLQVFGFAVIGLVVAVPLIQSSTLLGTAVLSRCILKTPISHRRLFAIALLILAVIVLSAGKELTSDVPQSAVISDAAVQNNTENNTAGTPVEPKQPEEHWGFFLLVCAAMGGAGAAYSIYIITLRFVLQKFWNNNNSVWISFQFTQWAGFDFPVIPKQGLHSKEIYSPFPVTLMMNIVLGTGIIIFGLCIWTKHGLTGFYEVPNPNLWLLVFIVGLTNALGFFFQIEGLRMTSAVQAQLITLSQMVILSLVGFFFFKEPVNAVIITGLLLTICGVMMSAKPENGTNR
ncbi:membrane protein [Planctomycetales bacterium]|nr:membrane protein [Planctomycetales bacterium]